MKLINPSEISARILTLLDESDERIIIVSPYMKISKWYKLINKVNKLKTRRIIIEIYVRDDPSNNDTYRDLDQMDLEYKKIPHLHCKLYMNEKYGIVTSMNLLLSSEINSLEVGYQTETWTEYNDLLRFYHRYIHIGELVHSDAIAGRPAADMEEVIRRLRKVFRRNAKNSWLWFADNKLHICTNWYNYSVSINDGYLRITACMRIAYAPKRKSIHYSSLAVEKVGDLTTMKVDTFSGPKPDILMLSGQSHNKLLSTCITGILEAEVEYVTESVRKFIDAVDDQVY